MTYIQAIILGLVQGIAEFLPISSSGHLAILQYFFNISSDNVVLFSILLHLGTLISVFICYWNDIWALIKELGRTIADIFMGRGLNLKDNPLRKFGMMIIVATIPTAIIGFVIDKFIDSLYNSLTFISIGLIITGILLIVCNRIKGNYKSIDQMNFRNAIFVGILQGFAVCPGISRSGSTLFGSLICKLDRDFAVKFVFILSIPPAIGSLILEIPDGIRAGFDMSLIGPVLVGMLVATVSGILAIKVMTKIVANKSLKYFSYYVWVLAIIVLTFTIML